MGKSAKWFKNVLLGKKQSKSSGSKGKEVLVTAKVEESDVVSDLPSFTNVASNTVDRSSGTSEAQNVELEEISDDEVQLPEGKPTDFQNVAPVQDNSLSDAEKIQQEAAATSVQAAFRGYLARRAFWALKGIIRLQAVIRGHLVRRQAVATLCGVMGIVKLQALARGRETRKSDIGVKVRKNSRLQMLQNKRGNSADRDAYLGIKKLTANTFALKLLASSPRVIPVHTHYDASNPNSSLVWLENWSASCFWKPVPQPKKTMGRKLQNKIEAESTKSKKSISKAPAANFGSSTVQTSFEFEKPKRNFRKVSRQSIEPPAVENPQIELEKVKRSLRKVHNPVVESSIQPQPVPHMEVEKLKLGVEKIAEPSYPLVQEPANVFDETIKKELPEKPEEVNVPTVEVHTPGPLETSEALDSSMVNQIDIDEKAMIEEEPSMEKDAKEEKTPKPNNKENSVGKENQKSKKKGLATNKTEREETNGHHQTSPSIPSYMQATKSAKAKLRLQGSPKSVEQDGTEKANVPRRHSLPSSGNGRITSNSPRTTRLTNSGDKTRNKEKTLLSTREGNAAKTAPVERKR